MTTVKATSSRDFLSGKGGKIALGVLVGISALLVLLYFADLALNRGHVPRGTTVGGVPIGGMGHDEARATLESELGGVEGKPVQVKAASQTSQIVPNQAGLGIDWQATVDAAGTEPINPFTRLRNLFTTREVDVVPTVNESALQPELERVHQELKVDPVDGAIRIVDGKAETTPAEPGQDVNAQHLRDRVTTGWLNPNGVTIDPDEIDPEIDAAALRDAEQGPVRAALSGPLTLKGKDDVAATIPQERLGEVVQFEKVNGKIEPNISRDAAQGIFGEQLAGTEQQMQNARVLEGGGVEPSKDGLVVDWDSSLGDFDKRVLDEAPRTWDAAYKPEPAVFTTEMAQKATFDEVVGTFTTGGYSEASGKNIGLVAEKVNGAIVNPGETFSLNGYTGPRGEEQGYVSSGIILNGRADKAVGGGISQFATTLYNAAYFAGMTDVAHTPHSYYISRYPAGREATVYEGAIDLQFRNDSTHPVKITTSLDGELTVNLMGVRSVTVESINGGRWDETKPEEITVKEDCIPSRGTPGFTTSDTRIIKDLAGNEISRETQTTVYDPQPIVRCEDEAPRENEPRDPAPRSNPARETPGRDTGRDTLRRPNLGRGNP